MNFSIVLLYWLLHLTLTYWPSRRSHTATLADSRIELLDRSLIIVWKKKLPKQWKGPILPRLTQTSSFEEKWHIFTAEMFEIAYLTTCYHKNASASGGKPPWPPLSLGILTTYSGFRVMHMTINRYKIDTKPMPFAVKKLHMKNSVNEFEIRNLPHVIFGLPLTMQTSIIMWEIWSLML